MSIDEKVQLLMDEREIQNVLYRFSRAVARADQDLARTCFYPDAMDHHLPFFAARFGDRIENFVKGCLSFEIMHYQIGNILIEIDGDVARTECLTWSASMMHERAQNGDRQLRLAGQRYLDRFERRDDQWKIAERWLIPEWDYFQNTPEQTSTIGPCIAPSQQTAIPIPWHRDREDLSYRF